MLCVFLATPLPHSDATQDSTLPYIYYYADTLNSFVVEQVDGSDSRVLAELPPEQTLFWAFDWSPSGAWAAWLSGDWNGPSAILYTPWVVRSDGSEPGCHALEGMHDVLFLDWSPVDDVLYVVERLNYWKLRLLLIDVPADKILTEFIYENPGRRPFETYPASSWSLDGQAVYMVIPTLETQTLLTLSYDGIVQARIFGESIEERGLSDFTGGRALYLRQWEQTSQLVVQDLASGQELVIATNLSQIRTRAIWNDDRSQALVQVFWDTEEDHTDYYWLNWDHETVTLLSITDYSWFSWSPNGQFAVLRDDESQLSVLDTQTGVIQPIDVSHIQDWQWLASDLIFWTLEGQAETARSNFYRYNPESQALTELLVLAGGDPYTWYRFAPDGTIVMDSKWPGSLVSVETGEPIPLIPHSLAQAGMTLAGAVWHPSSDWYMTGEHIFYAGGGGGPEAITLYSRDGNLRRELGLCFNYDTCAGFVPDRVIPHLGYGQAQSVVAEPVLTLKPETPVEAVAWSPDENVLATYALPRTQDEAATLTLWRVTNNEAHVEETYTVDIACGLYPGSCSMIWREDGTILFDNYQTVWVFNLTTQEIQTVPSADETISPDGLYRLEPGSDLTIIDIERNEVVLQAEPQDVPGYGFPQIYWLPGGHTLLVQQGDGRLFRWDGSYLQPIGSGSMMLGYAYHEQTGLLAGGSLYNRISVVDTQAGEHLADINWASSALSFNADGSLLAAGGTELVSIWDMTRFER
jgi:WD40 repeat protein